MLELTKLIKNKRKSEALTSLNLRWLSALEKVRTYLLIK